MRPESLHGRTGKPRGDRPAGPTYRRSRQRDRILELLESTGTHPSAGWLFARMRKDFPNLSLGTVYRNLGILIEQDKIRRISSAGVFDRLDANSRPHAHFICEKCGAIIDLDEPDVCLEERFRKEHGLVVRRHEVRFYGFCRRCAQKA